MRRSSRSNPPRYCVNSFVLTVSAVGIGHGNVTSMASKVQFTGEIRLILDVETNHVQVKTNGLIRKNQAVFVFADHRGYSLVMNMLPFSQWTPWVNRRDIEGCNHPGVYMLALDDALPAKVELIPKTVIYVGVTYERHLVDRWDKFHRTALKGKGDHKGGETFYDRFGSVAAHVPRLYVAALPVLTKENPRRSAYILHIERLLIWQYVDKFGELPRCILK